MHNMAEIDQANIPTVIIKRHKHIDPNVYAIWPCIDLPRPEGNVYQSNNIMSVRKSHMSCPLRECYLLGALLCLHIYIYIYCIWGYVL